MKVKALTHMGEYTYNLTDYIETTIDDSLDSCGAIEQLERQVQRQTDIIAKLVEFMVYTTNMDGQALEIMLPIFGSSIVELYDDDGNRFPKIPG